MASVYFPVRERPTSEGQKEYRWQVQRYLNNRPLDGKERKPGNTGAFLSHSEFAEILLHQSWQSMDELRERSRRWGWNQDFIKTPAGKCIKVFLFIIKLISFLILSLMHIIYSVWHFSKTTLFSAPRICKVKDDVHSVLLISSAPITKGDPRI
jgi:hypothetical protein